MKPLTFRTPWAALTLVLIGLIPSVLAGLAQDAGNVGKPVAMIDHRSLSWEELGPLLAEAAGGQVLDEVVLSDAVAKKAAEQGITLTPSMVEAERRLFTESLAATGVSTDPDRAERLLAEVRRSRGLGEQRFKSLLERSALLRAMVRAGGEVSVTDDDLQQAYRIRYGPQRRVRIILAATERDAQAALDRVNGAHGEAAESFSDVAVEFSTDASRTRGGLLGWVRTDDPAYPRALRLAVEALSPGQVAGPVVLENGFAVVKVEEVREEPQPSMESVRASLKDEVTAVRERAAMERLARVLLEEARGKVTVFDRALGKAWEQR